MTEEKLALYNNEYWRQCVLTINKLINQHKERSLQHVQQGDFHNAVRLNSTAEGLQLALKQFGEN